MADKEDNQWHLDKKVPLSLIFAMIVQAGMVIIAVSDIKKDVEVLKSQVATQHERDERQDKFNADSFQLLRTALEKIDQKLDRLMEKRK